MVIKLSDILQINVDDEKLVEWSHDRITGIYTFTFIDGSTWKYDSKYKKFYLI